MRLLSILFMLVMISGCQSLKRPSGDPAKISSDTLCYRAANKNSDALQAEIDFRNLDCARILEADPLYNRGAPNWR